MRCCTCQAKHTDPWESLCKTLRKSGPETRDAVMQGVRWDFFRCVNNSDVTLLAAMTSHHHVP
jgi:hypothetical protein